MILTIAKLRQLGACENALARLEATFGTGPIEVTEALCVAYAADRGCNWDWAAKHLLKPLERADYYRTMASTHAEFDRSRAAAAADHNRTWRNLSYTSARDEYVRICASMRADFDRIAAPVFGRLAEMQG